MAWLNVPEIIAFMNDHKLTAYDATYLELAMRLKLPLATFDQELISAAADAGIGLVS